MSEKIKNYLGIAIIIGILALSAAAAVYARAFSRASEPASFRSFFVSGEGQAVGIPDVGKFSFRVITEGGKDLANLQKENTQKTNKIIEFVKSRQVESKDIKTIGYNVEPRQQYFPCPGGGIAEFEKNVCPPPEIAGYTITQQVLVKVRDFQTIGDLLAGVVERGANSVSQLSFEVDDPTAVQNEAREEAIKKAKDKARGLAKAGDFVLGRLLSIQENGGGIPYYGYGGAGAELDAKRASLAVSPTIEPGSQEVTVNVTLQYEIK